MEKRRVGGIYIIKDPTHTFADEYQVRDIVLSPSEERKVRAACHKWGLDIHHVPTGRTVQLLLLHMQACCLQNQAAAKTPQERRIWYSEYLRVKQAIGKDQNG